MEANARNIERIFDSTVSYQIPLFQRPYVWNAEKNWQPLWEDIQALLERHLNNERSRAHFLGAVVLEQLNNHTGSIETRQVIDGQQRFTTLQIFMVAVRDLCRQQGSEKHYERFNDLVTNKPSKIDHDHEFYKVWPTNTDREAFRAVHAAESVTGLHDYIKAHPELRSRSHQILRAYEFFALKLAAWLKEMTEGENAVHPEDCLDALWQVIRNDLQLVVIDLDREDESQVIFETLNARGTQLLPADLIKNYLFRRMRSHSKDVEKLYERFWKPFDSRYWRTEVKQGRVKRPRIDLFMQHYLTLMLREEVKHSHLFEAFKQYVEDLEDGSIDRELGLTRHPDSVEDHLRSLATYAQAYQVFSEPEQGTRLELFMRRLAAVDTTTVYPLLLLACANLLPDKKAELESFLHILESYLIRRMVCGLTSKNYNRFFIDAIRSLDRASTISAEALENFLKAAEGESTKFPSDAEFSRDLIHREIYKYLAQYKVRAVLEALDASLSDRKSEAVPLPSGLTIEHVMPQRWQTNWPIPENIANKPEAKVEFSQNRDSVLHTLGNLTLITGSLNPALSNASWADKRPELCKFSKLNLNRYFYPPNPSEADQLKEWNEERIIERSKVLAKQALEIWPAAVDSGIGN